jgi:hypothetical protein
MDHPADSTELEIEFYLVSPSPNLEPVKTVPLIHVKYDKELRLTLPLKLYICFSPEVVDSLFTYTHSIYAEHIPTASVLTVLELNRAAAE